LKHFAKNKRQFKFDLAHKNLSRDRFGYWGDQDKEMVWIDEFYDRISTTAEIYLAISLTIFYEIARPYNTQP
jgi:hypothetical protein